MAGFHEVAGGPRITTNFNAGWRFMKGPAPHAEMKDYDDGSWQLVNVPHGLEVLPLEASGGINYQGEAWYRKRFDVPPEMLDKRIVFHFEGLMGKSIFWVNGKRITDHFGGFLPVVLDVTDAVNHDGENVLAVWVDNSDDPSYPPGKAQSVLDFAYFGGIYRDVWLVATNKVHVTDPNEVNIVAGGGVFVHYTDVSDEQATVHVDAHVANASDQPQAITVTATLKAADESEPGTSSAKLELSAGDSDKASLVIEVANPHLWHADDPNLYELAVRIDAAETVDAVRLRIGIRSIDFRGKAGFWLNGKPFDGKLVGVNRHQDHAYVGNAMSNNAHWRDAIKLRQAGIRVIRCAHYPQDPSFMDACDVLGMFVIITTPGWQFWNKDPAFEERVYSDIRNMVRRDRNRPSVLLWEPILNETNYPGYFAKAAHDITHEEYPYAGCYTACDGGAAGQQHFDVVYGHPHHYEDLSERNEANLAYGNEERCVFTREWGDCVADWRAQSSPSRANKAWGERAQLIQALHYARPAYVYTCYDSLCGAPRQHVGGTLWHGTDHYRGYHADAFWGGILDATRQPKYSYYMFRSQVPADISIPYIESGPFIKICHLIHPSSEPSVTIFSNCDEVCLKIDGRVVGCQPTAPGGTHMPRSPVVFENAFRFYRHGQKPQHFEAQGLINGVIVVTEEIQAWDRRKELVLHADTSGIDLQADGSDFIPVVARIIDEHGQILRLTDDTVRFTVTGPANIIDGADGINPQKLIFGEAVVLLRATTEPGTITVRAESAHPGVGKPASCQISLDSVPPHIALHFTEFAGHTEQSQRTTKEYLSHAELKKQVEKLSSEINEMKLRQVEKQQEDFA
ncbi:MAG: glycoside hydrolase family 2 TIM barrel-domain containing protein [Lentisphaeria bacterium]|nr:glycoside hydrolase family 2 TIM barrel-domain containing protein [Lentisphaeria bacterium]